MIYYAHTADGPDGKPAEVEHWQLLKDHLGSVADLAGKFALPLGMETDAKLAGLLPGAFAQFESGTAGKPAVDLMFVDAGTWEKMWAGARSGEAASRTVFTPRPEHLVALKLHAASSATRSKPESDWEDIRQIIRICELSAEEPEFRAMILRYGGQNALERIESFLR